MRLHRAAEAPMVKYTPAMVEMIKPANAAEGIQDDCPVYAEFLNDQRCQLTKSQHIEDYMQQAAMQIICG